MHGHLLHWADTASSGQGTDGWHTSSIHVSSKGRGNKALLNQAPEAQRGVFRREAKLLHSVQRRTQGLVGAGGVDNPRPELLAPGHPRLSGGSCLNQSIRPWEVPTSTTFAPKFVF
jgi:hypothetical protein